MHRLGSLVSRPFAAAVIVAISVGVPILVVGDASDRELRARAESQMFQAGSGAAERALLSLDRQLAAVRSELVAVAAGTARSALTEGSDAALFDVTVRGAFATGRAFGGFGAKRVALTNGVGDVLMELDDEFLAALSRVTTPGAFLRQGGSVAAPTSAGFQGRRDPVAQDLLATPPNRYNNALLLPAVVSEPFTRSSKGIDHTVVALGTPVFPDDLSRSVIAMLVVEYPLAVLERAISSLPPEAEDIYVVDRNGRFLMSTRPTATARLTDLTASVIVKKTVGAQPLLAGVLSVPTVREFGRDPFTGGSRPFATAVMREVGWHALVVPKQTALEGAEVVIGQLRAARGAIVLVLIVAAFGLTTFLRQVASQRAQLADANRALGEASERIALASRHKSEFLSNMSHELRTPLNAIIGFADVLAQRLAGELNAKQSEYVGDIAGSGRHLLDLVNEVLDLSKVEAGRMALEPSEFDPAESIHAALALVRERAADQRIELAAEVPADLGRLLADERKFRQILLNLLSNAVKFTPDGGWIGVTAWQQDGELRLSVRDTGVGIAAADQARVFDEFQQVGRDPDRAREGTGLGLTLAKRFVELHGGRIWVESEVGKGSTFTFAIPVRQTALADAKA